MSTMSVSRSGRNVHFLFKGRRPFEESLAGLPGKRCGYCKEGLSRFQLRRCQSLGARESISSRRSAVSQTFCATSSRKPGNESTRFLMDLASLPTLLVLSVPPSAPAHRSFPKPLLHQASLTSSPILSTFRRRIFRFRR